MGSRGGDLHVSVSIDDVAEVTATKPSVLVTAALAAGLSWQPSWMGYAPSIPRSRAPRDVVSFRIDAAALHRGSSCGGAGSAAAGDPKLPIPRQFILF